MPTATEVDNRRSAVAVYHQRHLEESAQLTPPTQPPPSRGGRRVDGRPSGGGGGKWRYRPYQRKSKHAPFNDGDDDVDEDEDTADHANAATVAAHCHAPPSAAAAANTAAAADVDSVAAASAAAALGDWRRNCGAINCVHQIGNICTDILLQPELYLDLFSHKGKSSSNPLLEFCLDGGYQMLMEKDKRTVDHQGQMAIASQPDTIPSILTICSTLPTKPEAFAFNMGRSGQQLQQLPCQCNSNITASLGASMEGDNELLQEENDIKHQQDCFCCLGQLELFSQKEGCDINVQNSQGFSALHFLINGCSKENFELTQRAVSILLEAGINCNLADAQGNTAMLSLSHMLDKKLFGECHALAKSLLENCQSPADPNLVNSAGRTLLSHAVSHGDQAVQLTRLLLNNGAKVLRPAARESDPTGRKATPPPPQVEQERRDQSAFTWFLKAVMRKHSLEGSEATIKLLCQAMSQETGSGSSMKHHVISTMIHLGKCTRAVGPLFLQIKQAMSAYWREPQSLSYLCLKTIRKSIGPKNLSQRTEQLQLPRPLTSYLQLY